VDVSLRTRKPIVRGALLLGGNVWIRTIFPRK
jgi:hypothetical protein